MKPFVLLFFLSAFLMASRQDEIKALYDEVIEKTREDMLDEIKSLKNPFIKPLPATNTSSTTNTQKADNNQTKPQALLFELQAIINEKAKINNDWYQKGETINGYRVSFIKPYAVYLTSIVDDGRVPQRTLHLLDTDKLNIKHSIKQPEIKVDIK